MKYDLVGKEKVLIKTALFSMFMEVVEGHHLGALFGDDTMLPIVAEFSENEETTTVLDVYEDDPKLLLSDMLELIKKLK